MPRARLSLLVTTTALLGTSLAAQTAADTALKVNAAVTSSPPAIAFQWPGSSTATSYAVIRRVEGTAAWDPSTTVPGGGNATSWTDTNVLLGERYEYRFVKSGGTVARTLVTAGIEATAIHDRGKLILIVDSSQAGPLAAGIDRLILDLIGDGWQVVRHDVARTETVPNLKALIVAEHAADPANVKAVFLFGHVPVPYSGNINPDGHSNHRGAWAADLYYGELDGVWTDTLVNNTTASRTANHNIPGDGKFDNSAIPSNVDLMVGRVDLANMPAFAASETALLQAYLDKDHDYRHKVFAVDQRAVIDDNFGFFSGEAFAATGWRNFAALVGTANVAAGDYLTTLNTTTGGGHVWSYGCGGGSYTSASGVANTGNFTTSTNRGVFTILFGSYFGDWDSTNNFLRAPLCSGWTLSNCWAGRPHWSFHPMGLGRSLGYCARYSQNDILAGGYGTRWVHVGLMGDPTLRQHVIAPPSAVAAAVVQGQVALSWTASSDPIAGYQVYRATSAAGPFTNLTPVPVPASTYTDLSPPLGPVTYMVRATRLETTPTGTYWNLSQGAFASVGLPLAEFASSGAGCAQGTQPAPALSAPALPILGATATIELANCVPNSFAFLLFDDPPLLSMTVAGMPPGCIAYVDPFDALAVVTLSTDANGVLSYPMTIPNVPGFAGIQFAIQGAAPDLTLTTPYPFLVSNGAILTVGF